MRPLATGAGGGVPPRPGARSGEEPPVLGLALGGGGGKGGAHLGVLAALETLGLPIDRLAGTSIGGLIGVLYAAGHGVDAIERAMSGQSLWRLFGRDPDQLGLSGNAQLRALLTALLGERTFADLAIPAAVMTTDLVTGRAVLLDRGPVVEAILATMALPGLLPPIERDGQLLADGGIVDNLPVGAARALGARKVIAVALDAAGVDFALEPVREGLLGWLAPQARRPLALADRGLTLLLAQQTRHRLERMPLDLLLTPRVANLGTIGMAQLAEGRAAGAAAAREALGALHALRAWRGTDPRRGARSDARAMRSGGVAARTPSLGAAAKRTPAAGT
jgi:NTE family protein